MSEEFEYDIFLSHSTKDKPAVRELANRLKKDGLRVWLDEWVIKPGDAIPLAVEKGLTRSRTLVLVMSQNAFASEWVTLERHTALFRDPTNQKRSFVPLRLDDADINDMLKQFAYVDWRKKDRNEYDKLLAACQATSGIHLSEHSEAKRAIDDLLAGPHFLRNTATLLNLVDRLQGRVSFPLMAQHYPRYLKAFESIPAHRYSLCRPGSSLRRKPMSLELGRFLYAKRGFSDTELEEYIADVNTRAQLVQSLLTSHEELWCEEFVSVNDLKAFVNDNVFVRTRQALCEVTERINAIAANLRDCNRYTLFLFKEDVRPFFDNFFLKLCPVGDRIIRFVIKFGGTPDRDAFIILSNQEEHLEYEQIIRQLRDRAHPLDDYPQQGLVYRVDQPGPYLDWIGRNTSFQALQSSACDTSIACLKDNASFCPAAECPAGNFSSIYNVIDDTTWRQWQEVADHRKITFEYNPITTEFGITLVAGYPFHFANAQHVRALATRLTSLIGKDQVYLFDEAYWHATVVAFRRSRAQPWEAHECPTFEVVGDLTSLEPFSVRFTRHAFGQQGEVVLCGSLDDSVVASLNKLRNRLLIRSELGTRESSFVDLRPGTDRPKHRLAFHVTIGALIGEFTLDRLGTLRQRRWIEDPIVACVEEFRLLQYKQRNCFELVGLPVGFRLGQKSPLDESEIRKGLHIQ